MSCLPPQKPFADAATAGGAVSSGNSSSPRPEAQPEKYSGPPFDLWRLKKVLPDHWMRFLHAHFSSHIHVAYVFGVNERTARLWWEGAGSPRTEVTLAACRHIPGAVEYLLEAA